MINGVERMVTYAYFLLDGTFHNAKLKYIANKTPGVNMNDNAVIPYCHSFTLHE